MLAAPEVPAAPEAPIEPEVPVEPLVALDPAVALAPDPKACAIVSIVGAGAAFIFIMFIKHFCTSKRSFWPIINNLLR